MLTFKPGKILHPTDFSETSTVALRWADSLASHFSAELTVVYADRFVPVLLGDRWTNAVPVLVNLCGFMLFASLFEVLKMYFIAIHQTRRLLAARIVQYLGMLVPLGVLHLVGGANETTVGLGVSIAYAAAFAVGALLARNRAPDREGAG